ncbi:uncharacterized protein BDZ83DRAFT_612300 [Colletotrichum acutatum]|uniref:Uncharacterized protein n=1 Tax=Glomerella acutata TaxID=27357 RepID=A0AAD8UTP8_GLOAC|nr:uncharacterized protein BDZ83DRAFT_612300 [Colletotrichum acutatum]KAK1727583.1 hypothetical protein BDZ83DRAFT_612300 [Colletotrichum acutatum]
MKVLPGIPLSASWRLEPATVCRVQHHHGFASTPSLSSTECSLSNRSRSLKRYHPDVGLDELD